MVPIGISQTGWMTAATFLEYMQKIFYPFLCEQSVEFPVVVFVDGHTSHFSFHISEFCEEKKIVLIALYPNATHIIQPMDVAVFGPLKKKWRHAVHTWKFQNSSNKSLTKEHFAGLLQQVIVENVKPEYLQSGFRTCGLFPFDANGVNYGKLMDKNRTNDIENENEARAKEIERNEYSIAFKRIGEMIGSEKECSFFKFYSSYGEKPWDSTVEDTTAYYIWRDALKKSRNPETSALVDESILDEDQIHDIIELQNELITEEIINWDPETIYLDGSCNEVELEFRDEKQGEKNRLVHVLDNVVIVPASSESQKALEVALHKDSEPLPCTVAESPSTESVMESSIDSPNRQNTLNFEPQGSTSTQLIQNVSMAALHGLPAANECPVNEVFLKCLKPEEAKVEKTEEKFRVPKITGKISLHFSSALESHYISCIDFTSGTSVVSSKWHRDYIQKHKEIHDSAAERRLQRKMKKCSATTTAQTDELPKQSIRARKQKINLAKTLSSNVFGLTDDDDEDYDPKENPQKKKNFRVSRKPISIANVLDSPDTSESSFSPSPKKTIRKIHYTSDEN